MKINVMLTLIACLFSVSLFAANSGPGDEYKTIKVFSSEELKDMNFPNTAHAEISEVKLVLNDGSYFLQVTGVDIVGNTVVSLEQEFEMLPCGSCLLYSGAPWKYEEGQMIIWDAGQYASCIKCEYDQVPFED